MECKQNRKDLKNLDQQMQLKGYSIKTRQAYLYHVQKYLTSNLKPRKYLLDLIQKGNSDESVRLAGFAIKFYLKNKGYDIDLSTLPNIKRKKTLPTILSKKEVEKMIYSTTNLKHRLIIQMLYSAGLRLSELINLRFQDIDYTRNTIHIRRAKGKKDRIVMLSPKVKKLLKTLDKKDFVFKTNIKTKYSPRTIQQIVKNAAQKASITKKVTPHTLRHSYATHLLENGIDIRIIQQLLGHADLHTTMLYTKVSTRNLAKIKTPLDQ